MSGTVFLGQTELLVDETDGTAQVVIQRAGPLTGAVTLTFGVTGDTATAGQDFSVATTTAVIPDGVASITVPVTILNDGLAEGTEVMTFALINAQGAGLLAPRTTRISILDDEAPSPPPPAEPPLINNYTVGFTNVVTGLNQPVRFAFNPIDQSQVFIVEKGGVVRVSDLDTPATTSTVFLDISARVNAAQDRGLLGVALHPDFANNPYVYLYYVVDPAETGTLSGNAGRDGGGNRYAVVERFTADAATGYTTVVANSNVIILGGAAEGLADVNGGGALDFTDPIYAPLAASDRWINPSDPTPPALVGGFKQDFIKADSRSHNGGAMVFGPDGALYIATGDAVSFNYADPRAPDVLLPDSLSGKILRIDPLTGNGLADNPFVTAGLDLDSNRAKVFQLGLRNPFSFAVDDDGRVIIAEVGYDSFEEINIGGPGANFGWPYFEGVRDGQPFRAPNYRDLPAAQAFYDAVAAGQITITRAVQNFGHAAGDPGFQVQAIIGGNVAYDGNRYPAEFLNDFFFADFNSGRLFSMDTYATSELRYLGQPGGLIHFEENGDGYVYVANIFNGTISRMEIAATAPPPVQTLATLGNATLADAALPEFRLTTATTFQLGAVASSTRIDLRQDARFVLDYNFGANDGGADGGGFALHNDSRGFRAIGAGGGELGLVGLARAIAIEFDTWRNDNSPDIANDHAVIFAPGNGAFGTGVNGTVDLGNIENGAWQRIEITWTAATGTLAYSFNGTPRDSRTGGIIETALNGSNFAHFLFTGATGGAVFEARMRLIAADVTFEDIAEAQAPWIFGGNSRSVTVAENLLTPVLTAFASDAEGDTIGWRILPELDGARFSIDGTTGAVSFLAPPDFENPLDANGDNIYQLTIEARDRGGLIDTQRIEIRVTDIANEGVVATNGADTLLGTAGGDSITALGGNDSVRGLAGNDTIFASLNDGNDTYNGGTGGGDLYSLENTTAPATVRLHLLTATSAETGADTIRGIEHVTGGPGGDTIVGNGASNELRGLTGADSLHGGNGDDLLEGGEGNDTIEGGGDADMMIGGPGNDRYSVDDIEDIIIELPGGGADTVVAYIDFTLDANLEAVALAASANLSATGNAFDNAVTGNNGNNVLRGLDGADTLRGGAGADTLIGGAGADRLEPGTGADLVVFNNLGDLADLIVGYVGTEDTLQVSAAGFGGGLTEGMNLVALGRYIENTTGLATAPAGIGQFIYRTSNTTLLWDADGVGAGAAVPVATFQSSSGFNGAEIVVIA